MRVDSQKLDGSLQQTSISVAQGSATKQVANTQLQQGAFTLTDKTAEQSNTTDTEGFSKDKLEKAVESINEFLQLDHTTSKFVFHEGLNKYYVHLVDTDTDEVIKEIPPERLLDAFYQMQKLAGMIVDEKI